MSDRKTQDEGDLLQDTEQPDAATDAAIDTDGDQENPNGEQEQEGLDLEDDKSDEEAPSSKGEEQKLKQIRSLQAKVDSGEYTQETLPENLGWAKEFLRFKTKIDENAIESILEKKEQAREFARQKELLTKADLSSDQIKKINEKFKHFRARGMSKLDALNEAQEFAGVDLEQIGLKQTKQTMAVPKPGAKATAKDFEKIFREQPFSVAKELIPPDELDRLLISSAQGK